MKKYKKMVIYFNKKDLVSFGTYLLSEERTEKIAKHPDSTPENVADRVQQVSHADVENWLANQE